MPFEPLLAMRRVGLHAIAGLVAAAVAIAALGCGDDSESVDGSTDESAARTAAADYFDKFVRGDPATCDRVSPRAQENILALAKAYQRRGQAEKYGLDPEFYAGVESCGEAIERAATMLDADQAELDFQERFADAEVEIKGEKATVRYEDENPINTLTVPMVRLEGEWLVDQGEIPPPYGLQSLPPPP